MNRSALLECLANLVTAIARPHPVRVAVDGVDAAGKTSLADQLVQPIRARGRPVIRASIDGFLRPRDKRYRRGEDSAEGYYFDAFDYSATRELLLLPLGPGGNRRYRTATFDWRSDTHLSQPFQKAPQNAVLLFDGVFCQRPELEDCWEFRIFVDVDFAESVRRGIEREQGHLGSVETPSRRYWQRYVPGQRIYLEHVRPRQRADVVVLNSDPNNACLEMNPTHG